MNYFVSGYIDYEISYCPYCGEELDTKSCVGATECPRCHKHFYVIEGDSEE